MCLLKIADFRHEVLPHQNHINFPVCYQASFNIRHLTATYNFLCNFISNKLTSYNSPFQNKPTKGSYGFSWLSHTRSEQILSHTSWNFGISNSVCRALWTWTNYQGKKENFFQFISMNSLERTIRIKIVSETFLPYAKLHGILEQKPSKEYIFFVYIQWLYNFFHIILYC